MSNQELRHYRDVGDLKGELTCLSKHELVDLVLEIVDRNLSTSTLDILVANKIDRQGV